MARKSKNKSSEKPETILNKDLKDMDIRVNELGEIVRDYSIDTINTFLKDRVPDKKLTDE